ncbi:MAG: glycoside hydrolase family 5 protein, partial [Gemmatimonadota bacterium]|nr:glycoside hydrolase family 5 protein [Gemmatimonadota bacterium]
RPAPRPAAAPAPSGAPAPPLRTDGRFIVDRDGRRVRLNAVNWYGAESRDFAVGGLERQPLDTIADEIRRLGFNAVRLPWSNELVERDPTVPGRTLAANPALVGRRALDVLDRVVAALTRRGLMVILDDHNGDAEWCCGRDGNELWYNARYPESSWIADWRAMASRYRDDRLVVGADLRNEPRGAATWGGPPATDWRAAAQRGGNAVLGVNPNLLIFVEGTSYAANLSGVDTLPVVLDLPDRVVYEAHDYAWFEPHGSYAVWAAGIGPRWGYLVTGPRPRPFWIGEFGTCHTAPSCIAGDDPKAYGSWFADLTRFLAGHAVGWGYWAVNGTQSTGAGRTFGAVEGYGVLDSAWRAPADAAHLAALRRLMRPSSRIP